MGLCVLFVIWATSHLQEDARMYLQPHLILHLKSQFLCSVHDAIERDNDCCHTILFVQLQV